jgi:hypothetical protein
MFYTGINPFTGEEVYVARSYEEKQLQRALLQFNRRENAALVRKALIKAGREDLIGNGKDCLVAPYARVPAKGLKSNVKDRIATKGKKKK